MVKGQDVKYVVGKRFAKTVKKQTDTIVEGTSHFINSAADKIVGKIAEQLRQKPELAFKLWGLMADDRLSDLLTLATGGAAQAQDEEEQRIPLKATMKRWRNLKRAQWTAILSHCEPAHLGVAECKAMSDNDLWKMGCFALHVRPDELLDPAEPELKFFDGLVTTCMRRYKSMGNRLHKALAASQKPQGFWFLQDTAVVSGIEEKWAWVLPKGLASPKFSDPWSIDATLEDSATACRYSLRHVFMKQLEDPTSKALFDDESPSFTFTEAELKETVKLVEGCMKAHQGASSSTSGSKPQGFTGSHCVKTPCLLDDSLLQKLHGSGGAVCSPRKG
jgi:hypothetical protein